MYLFNDISFLTVTKSVTEPVTEQNSVTQLNSLEKIRSVRDSAVNRPENSAEDALETAIWGRVNLEAKVSGLFRNHQIACGDQWMSLQNAQAMGVDGSVTVRYWETAGVRGQKN